MSLRRFAAPSLISLQESPITRGPGRAELLGGNAGRSRQSD